MSKIKHWYTNGTINKYCFDCPEGFKRGRTLKKNYSECSHFTNGSENVFCEVCPEGFWPGITTHKERKKTDNVGKQWFTDGEKNIFTYDCPEGFVHGLTSHKKREPRVSPKFEELKARVDEKEFLSYYETHCFEDCAKHYNTSRALISKLAQFYGFVDSEKRQEAIEKRRVNKLVETNKSSEIKEKRIQTMRQTCLNKYGVSKSGRAIYALNSEATDEFKNLLFNTELCKQFFEQHNKEFTKQELCDRFKCNINSLNNLIYNSKVAEYVKCCGGTSHYETQIASLLPEVHFVTRDRFTLTQHKNGFEIDLYSPEHKIGIEFNGDYWHSYQHLNDKFFHQAKSKLAEKQGIRLIHIYEYEWNDPAQRNKIIQMLNIAFGILPRKIYARNCEVRQISNSEARVLNEKVHLQGHRDAQVTYGLYYEGELVQLMSFSKTHYNRNIKGDNDWEIIRGCPGSNNIVVGGVSKLFKHFIMDYSPDSVFSYCDFNKFDGKSYEALGMEFIGYTAPDLSYVMPDGSVVKRNPKRYQEYKKNSIAQIYGAGSKKYLWKREVQ